jgi:hypothetical protein
MLRKLAITTLVLAAALVGSAEADIYRWKDAQGVFHYSDQWVPGSELIKANSLRPPGSETSSASKPASSDPTRISANANSQLQQDATSRAVQQDVSKAREEQCTKAKDAYDKAVAARRIFKPESNKDGEKDYLSDAEADAYRNRVRAEMEQACAAAGK